MTENHPDPITEGLAQGGQRLVQTVSLAALLRQSHARRMQRLQEAREAKDAARESLAASEIRAVTEEARSHWAPAHDQHWLRQADLLQVARAWAAALPYAENSPAAAAAVRKCEQRLRELHPHAMEHYDRFRSTGLLPEDALASAAPFFTRDPNVRTGSSSPERQRLDAGSGTQWAAADHGPTRTQWEEHRKEQRGHQIVGDRIGQKPEIQPGELHTGLVNDTNLPEHLIVKITSSGADPAGRKQRSAAEVAADDFPLSIEEAMQLTAQRPHQQPTPRKPRNPSPDRNRRNGR